MQLWIISSRPSTGAYENVQHKKNKKMQPVQLCINWRRHSIYYRCSRTHSALLVKALWGCPIQIWQPWLPFYPCPNISHIFFQPCSSFYPHPDISDWFWRDQMNISQFLLVIETFLIMLKISSEWGPVKLFLSIDYDYGNICFLKKKRNMNFFGHKIWVITVSQSAKFLFFGFNEWDISVYFGPLFVLVKTISGTLANSALGEVWQMKPVQLCII